MGGALNAGPQIPSPDDTSNASTRGVSPHTEPIESPFIASKMLNSFTKFGAARSPVQAFNLRDFGVRGPVCWFWLEIKHRLILIARLRRSVHGDRPRSEKLEIQSKG